jgi:diaminopimelate decarboxylase
MLFDLVGEVFQETGVKIDFINLGGGVGIPYRPEQKAVDLKVWSDGVKQSYENKIVKGGLAPVQVTMECGRMITGPYGYLVSTVLHKKEIYKNYIGLDACMANLMRPALYGSYHHITIMGKENQPHDHMYDVTGSLCENNDKFAIDRMFPKIDIGDIVVIHDTGAHGHAMGFNYNAKLRSAEILLKENGSAELIRRAETIDDYFACLDFSKL